MTADELAGPVVVVGGYPLRTDRCYDPETHLWVREVAAGRVLVGMDALTAETSGTLAQLAVQPAGTPVVRGQAFGSLEAAKFVGPMISPVTGTLVRGNEAVLADPDLVLRDPYDAGWLAEIEPSDWASELPLLLCGTALRSWLERAVADYRERGLIAE